MFARVKTIKGNPYLYLVENNWVKGKVKQVVKKYLGRVFVPAKREDSEDVDFFEMHNVSDVGKYFKSHSREEIVRDVIRFELVKHNFEVKSKNRLAWENVIVDLKNFNVRIKKRDTALKLNEGYLYSEIIKEVTYLPE